MIPFAVGLVSLAATAAAATSMNPSLRGISRLTAGLVVASAEVVVLSYSLSLFGAWRPGAMIFAQLVVAGIAGGLAWTRGWRPTASAVRHRLAAIRVPGWRDTSVRLMSVAIALTVVGTCGLAVTVAPNNWDSMVYHLARIGYWVQAGSILHFENGTAHQLHSGVNAEVLQGWTMLLYGTDRLAQLVQTVAYVGSIAAVFSLARELGSPRAAALFGALLYASFPLVVLEASTTQNDLVVSFFLVAGLLHLVRAIRRTSLANAAIAGLAVGAACGTKATAFLGLVAIGLLAISVGVAAKPSRRFLVKGSALAIALAAVVGAPNYVENWVRTGHPAGELSAIQERTSPLLDNAWRTSWTFADTPAATIEWLDETARETATALAGPPDGENFVYAFDSAVHEDTTAFGLLGLLVLWPVILVSAVHRKTRGPRRALALGAIAYYLLFVLLFEYDLYRARPLLPITAIAAALLAQAYTRPWLRTASAMIALLGLIPALMFNAMKPLKPWDSAIGDNRLTDQTRFRADMAPVIGAYEQLVPPGRRVGLIAGGFSWEYPFFGAELDREVVRWSPATVDILLRQPGRVREFMRDESLDAVLFADVNYEPRIRTVPLDARHFLLTRRE